MDYRKFVLKSANWYYYNYTENLLRASIGFHAEYKEYLFDKSLDELGDCLFWWTVLVEILGYDLNSDKDPIDTDLILDRVEKLTRINKTEVSDKKRKLYISQIRLELGKFPLIVQSLENLQQTNMAKLLGRETV